MKRMRVLIADDEEAVRSVIAAMCQSLGHIVVGVARDGTEALALLEETRPDLALLDIKMPEPNGIEVARVISQRQNIPVLIVTAFADDNLMRQAAESGVFSYLLKPLTRDRLAEAISTVSASFTKIQKMQEEIDDLKQSLEERKLIERAKGILMRDMKVGEQEAFSWLKRTSSHSNTKLVDVARRLIALETNPGPRVAR
jgi:response regulator NasT